MLERWWELPGPSAYVGRVVDELREGRLAVLCLPEHHPAGLTEAIRRSLGEEGLIWQRLRVEGSDTRPVDQLFNRFVPEASPTALRNVQALVHEETFQGRIIVLEGMSAANWPAWREFLVEYGHACRVVPTFARTLFLVPLVGDVALHPPPEDVCVSCLPWKGYVDRLDMLLYASGLLRAKPLANLHRQIAAASIAYVAIWDPAVAERLADAEERTMLEPIPVLAEIAAERGWEAGTVPVAWHKGTSAVVGGVEQVHSALLAGDPKQIGRRLWSAQVSVLFPFVEERRQELLSRIGPMLQVPFQTPYGQVNDLQDLEVGPLEHQLLSRNLPVTREVRRLTAALRRVRNSLAHLEPLDADALLSSDLLIQL